mgnify:CR=1 FL=1
MPGADELAPDFVGLESMLELFHKATGEGFFWRSFFVSRHYFAIVLSLLPLEMNYKSS